MTSSPLMIETRGVTKRFGRRTAVDGLDLQVPRGCAFGLLGHNGAGKTTLLRMLVGQTAPDAGTITVGGLDLRGHRARVLARVGAVVEQPHFHGHLTGRENLRIVAAVRGPRADALVEPALARVGLTDRAGDRVAAYSQGMRQRLGLARCLLADPELVVLDEPTNGLDPGGILELRALVAGLVAEGRTVLVSSHLLDEIERTCDAAAVVDRGRLVWQGPIRDLVDRSGTRLDLTCDDAGLAATVLASLRSVQEVEVRDRGAVRVTLADPGAVGAVVAHLAGAGITVHGLAPVRTTLEERFLQITSRVGSPS